MRGFRRSQSTSFESEVAYASANSRVATQETASLLPRRDYGPILVAVNGHSASWDALDWATAEAAARQCALRILHTIDWPSPIPDISGGTAVSQWDASAEEVGARVLEEAACRARSVAPSLSVTTHVHLGALASALLQEGREVALLVLDRERPGSVSKHVIRKAGCPVAIVELSNKAPRGSSCGRVVVSVDGTGDPTAAIGFAFRAAQRRGIGVTAILPWMARNALRCDAQFADVVRMCQAAYPDVEVRQRLAAAPTGPALVAESAGAALIVLGSRAGGRARRGTFESVDTVLRSVRAPVVIVRTAAAKRRRGARGKDTK